MQYVIVGIGGQGILFSSKVMGHLALRRGEDVVGSEVHGMAQRGGSVISHFKVGSYGSPTVPQGTGDVLLAFDQTEALRNLTYLRSEGQGVINVDAPEIFANEDLQNYLETRRLTLHLLRGYEILKEKMDGKYLFLNVLMLGALCGAGVGDFTLEEARQGIEDLAPPKFVEANLKALRLGYEGIRQQ